MTDTIERSGGPAHTFKVGDDLPDLDAEMRYLIESSAGHKTTPMTAAQCLAFLDLVPEVDNSFDNQEDEDIEWNLWPC